MIVLSRVTSDLAQGFRPMPKLVTSIARRVLRRETYLNWQLDRTNRLYRKLVEDARRKRRAGSDDVEALRSEWSFKPAC